MSVGKNKMEFSTNLYWKESQASELALRSQGPIKAGIRYKL